MAFANSWVETDPDGAVITGSLLDDHQRLTKRAVRERLEGDPANPNSGIFEVGSFAATAIVRAGTARAYVVTAANLGTLTLQDGRIAITSDTARLYHLKGSGLVELAYLPVTGGAISGNVTINAGGVNPLTLNRTEGAAGQMAHIFFNRAAVVKGSIGITAADSLAINDSGGIARVVIAAASPFVTIIGSPSVAIQSTLGADVYFIWKGIAASGHLNWAIGKSFTVANAMEFIPSTAADGAVFTTPAMILNSTGVLVAASFTGLLNTGTQPNLTTVGNPFTIGSLIGNDRTLNFSDAANTFALKYISSAGGQRISFLDGALSERLTVFGTGQVTIATQVIVSAAAGDLVLGNAKSLRSVTIAGNDTIRLIEGNASNQVVIASGGQTTLVGGLFSIVAGQKLNLDTIGDTYIQELAANVMTFVVGGTEYLRITSATNLLQISLADVAITPAKKFFVDGGGDTYIYEVAANIMDFYAGGVRSLVVTATDVNSLTNLIVSATKKFYLDGGGDTYIWENAANQIQVVAGGTIVYYATNAGISIPSTLKLYLDGGGDTYIYESAANQFDIVSGGTNYFRVIPNQVQVRQTASLVIDAAQKFFLDGGTGGNTYIQESSADNLVIVVGGVAGHIQTATTLNLSNLTTITGATTYSGNVTGNVTGNLTGTVLTASQTNITAVGTLASVVVSGLADVGSLKVGGGATVTKFLTATYTYNPPSIAAGGFDSFSVTVTGAAVGDTAIVDNIWANNGLLSVSAMVQSADAVFIRLQNPTASAIDALSVTGRVWVIKP